MIAALGPAAKILIVGGFFNIVLSFLLGWLLSVKRLKEPITKHEWLLTAHRVSLFQGTMLLALVLVLLLVRPSPAWTAGAAWALVAASFFQDFSGIINWLSGTGDQFKERSFGWVFATINAFLNTAGLVILGVGLVRGLVA